jgi:tetratricopeptide (TPR) repeat protein
MENGMKKLVYVAIFLVSGFFLFAQDPLMSGLDAYARSDWSTAILSFRKAVSYPDAGSEPWYWLAMSELSAGQYQVALSDIDRFASSFPSEPRLPDIQYQKGRALYVLGKYEDSIRTLYDFITRFPDHAMVSAAYYWIGECLYSVGRYDEAKNVFNQVLEKFPQSVKREASLYRIALIEQSGKQEELLKLLKTSHEESLNIIEDYQRREKTYEQAINAYQKRISDMIKDTRLGELEKQLGDEKVKNSALLDKISALEIRNNELTATIATSGAKVPASAQDTGSAGDINSSDPEQRRLALEALRNKAQSLQHMYDQILDGGKQ